MVFLGFSWFSLVYVLWALLVWWSRGSGGPVGLVGVLTDKSPTLRGPKCQGVLGLVFIAKLAWFWKRWSFYLPFPFEILWTLVGQDKRKSLVMFQFLKWVASLLSHLRVATWFQASRKVVKEFTTIWSLHNDYNLGDQFCSVQEVHVLKLWWKLNESNSICFETWDHMEMECIWMKSGSDQLLCVITLVISV